MVELVDRSSFSASAAHSLCKLRNVHAFITDGGIGDASTKMLKAHDIRVTTVAARASEPRRVLPSDGRG
jgi:DeoR/GlpR family transcriptional regulator of sugar metabolism